MILQRVKDLQCCDQHAFGIPPVPLAAFQWAVPGDMLGFQEPQTLPGLYHMRCPCILNKDTVHILVPPELSRAQ